MAQPKPSTDGLLPDEGRTLLEQIQARNPLDPRRWVMQALYDSMTPEEVTFATQQNLFMLAEIREVIKTTPGGGVQAATILDTDVATGRPRFLPAGVDPSKTCEYPVRVRQKKSKSKAAVTKPCGAPVRGADPRYCEHHTQLQRETQPGS